MVPVPNIPPPPLIWYRFYGPSSKTWRKIGNALFFYKIIRIEHNKLILFLILMISLDYEKIQVFFFI